jgi:hypothetical protein
MNILKLKKLVLKLVLLVFALQLHCADNLNGPAIANWKNLGLKGKLVNDLKIIDNWLYACAGKDGLYRLDIHQSNSEWTYVGLADSGVEKTLESGVTDVIIVGNTLLVSYVAGYQLQHSGIYRSMDRGITWCPSDSGMITTSEYPTTSQVIKLQQHPLDPDIVFAGTTVSLTYKSYDAGISWEKVSGTEGASAINFSISINPNLPNEVWIGGETGRFAPFLLHSINGGETWSSYIRFSENFGPYTYNNAVYDIAIDPSNENVIYFGMLGVIGKTYDKGETFQRILGWDDGIYRNWRISMNPRDPNELFATGALLYRTIDGGNLWQKTKAPLAEIYALEVDWERKVLFISGSSPQNGIYSIHFW